jgi:hypothetical protein
MPATPIGVHEPLSSPRAATPAEICFFFEFRAHGHQGSPSARKLSTLLQIPSQWRRDANQFDSLFINIWTPKAPNDTVVFFSPIRQQVLIAGLRIFSPLSQ